MIKSLDVDSLKSDWDGFIYNLHYESGYKTECNRNDLIEYLPELDYKNIDELVDTMPSEVDDDFSDFCQFD